MGGLLRQHLYIYPKKRRHDLKTKKRKEKRLLMNAVSIASGR